jgi:hypothetical protein
MHISLPVLLVQKVEDSLSQSHDTRIIRGSQFSNHLDYLLKEALNLSEWVVVLIKSKNTGSIFDSLLKSNSLMIEDPKEIFLDLSVVFKFL